MMAAPAGWVLLLVLALPGYLASQKPVQTVFGVVRIVGDSGAPLSGAEVLIGKRRTTTDPRGNFRIDSMPPGTYGVTIRHIGFHPLLSRIAVVAHEPTVADYYMKPAPHLLPAVVVESPRTGIYGVVQNPSLEPIVGAAVEAIGVRGSVVYTDSLGRFGFPGPTKGGYLIRVTRDGYMERRIMLELESGKGRDVTLQLMPGTTRRVGNRAEAALFDLRSSLVRGFRRDRMAGSELDRYGSISVCDVPRVRMVTGREEQGVLNGELALLHGQLCAWRMDEIQMIQFVPGTTRRGPGGPVRSDGYVIIWEKW